jgi:DNA-binding XRE family transcriptional regulator
MSDRHGQAPPIPRQEALRAWINQSRKLLGLTATEVASEAELARESVAKVFREAPRGGLNYETAFLICVALVRIAARRGVVLPEMEGRANV